MPLREGKESSARGASSTDEAMSPEVVSGRFSDDDDEASEEAVTASGNEEVEASVEAVMASGVDDVEDSEGPSSVTHAFFFNLPSVDTSFSLTSRRAVAAGPGEYPRRV